MKWLLTIATASLLMGNSKISGTNAPVDKPAGLPKSKAIIAKKIQAPGPYNRCGAQLPPSLAEGLWASFDFENESLIDGSGQEHNLNNAGARFTQGPGCNGDRALLFNSDGAYAWIPSGSSFPSGDFALALSIYCDDTHSGRIFNKADRNTALAASLTMGLEPGFHQQLAFGVTKEEAVCDKYGDLNNTNVLFSANRFEKGRWYDLVIQFEKGRQTMYVDGVLADEKNTGSNVFSVCNSAPFSFGTWWRLDERSFKGRIDNIRIYTRALSQDEIDALRLFNSSAPVAIR